jgi:predicted metallopeptidase
MIKYAFAPDVKELLQKIVQSLQLNHIKLNEVHCFRSHGSNSRNTIARCHALSKIWQNALNTNATYIIEVISEKYDKLTDEEKIKVLIHELLHIPKSFGGGFRHHDYACKSRVDTLYKSFKQVYDFSH